MKKKKCIKQNFSDLKFVIFKIMLLVNIQVINMKNEKKLKFFDSLIFELLILIIVEKSIWINFMNVFNLFMFD